jgi:hypothetical protein
MRFKASGLLVVSVLAGTAARPLAADPVTVIVDTKRVAQFTDNRRNPGEISPLAMGDVNGDGYDDIVMGAPRASSFTTVESGGVYIRFGGNFLFGPNLGTDDRGLYYDLTTPPNISSNRITSSVFLPDLAGRVPSGVQFIPERGGEAFGSAVAVGDFNGDGFMDVVISAPAPFGSRVGAVYLMYGRADIGGVREVDLEIFDGFGFEILGRAVEERFGESIIMADLDNDGYDDLIIGTPRHGVGGIVDIVWGLASPTYRRESIAIMPGPTSRIVSNVPGERFGTGLAARRLNGDNFPELAIGAPLWPHPSTSRGRALVFNLGGVRPPVIDLSVTPPYLAIESTRNHAGVGTALAIGDVDGDTLPDLVIAGPLQDAAAGINAGIIYIMSDPASSAGSTLVIPGDHRTSVAGTQPEDRLGTALAFGSYDAVIGEELFVGVPGRENLAHSARGAGAVYAYRTGTLPPGDLQYEDPSVPWTKFTVSRAWFGFGTSIAVGQFDRVNELDLFVAGDGTHPFNQICGSDEQSIYELCHGAFEGLRVFGVMSRSVPEPPHGLSTKPGWMALE